MEISKLYETALEKLEKAIDVCGKSKMTLSSLTVISSASGNLYSGINYKTLNDDFEEELTSSEDEAISKMVLSGESEIEHIITLDPETKLPVNPCQKCLELIITINNANVNCNVISGKNSKVILTSVNSEIAKFAEKLIKQETAEEPANKESDANSSTKENQGNEPEGSAAHAGIDASGLQMIFDDWESAGENPDAVQSKPFNASSLTTAQADHAEVVNQVQNMANNSGFPQQNNNMYGAGQQSVMYGQPMNGMYGQPMNGMYGQPNGMYQQQPNGMYGQPNGMYQQQPNGMYGQPNGMYQQQMNGGMYGGGQQSVMFGQPNGMYQQQNGMYGQPNGMYQQQMNGGMYGQQQNGARTSLYLNNNNNNQQNAQQNGNNTAPPQPGQNMYSNMPGSASSTYHSKLQASVSHSVANTQSVSVYGTNINDSDNNAIFKDRLNDILNSGTPAKPEKTDKMDVMMSAKEKKNAAKKDAKKK